jgi:hypothetical protein
LTTFPPTPQQAGAAFRATSPTTQTGKRRGNVIVIARVTDLAIQKLRRLRHQQDKHASTRCTGHQHRPPTDARCVSFLRIKEGDEGPRSANACENS